MPQYLYTDTVVRICPEEFGKNLLTLRENLFYDTPKCDVRGGLSE